MYARILEVVNITVDPLAQSLSLSGRDKPVLIMHIGFFAIFSRHISRTQSFSHIIFHALVALKMLVSLISRLVACSPRIVVDKQTDRPTDTQNDYCNPRCAGLTKSEARRQEKFQRRRERDSQRRAPTTCYRGETRTAGSGQR